MIPPPGTIDIREYNHNTDEPQSLAEQRGALWKVVFNSSRESADYSNSLVRLIQSKTERNVLYKLKVSDAEIDRIINVLNLVSVTGGVCF